MLTRDKIKKMAGYSYQKGAELQRSKQVKSYSIEEKGKYKLIEARVRGNEKSFYPVFINMEKESEQVEDCDCACKAFSNCGGLCKHCTAVLLEYVSRREEREAIWNYLQEYKGNYSGGKRQDKLSGKEKEADGMAAASDCRTAIRARFATTPDLKMLLEQQARRQILPIMQGDIFGKVRLEPYLICERNRCQAEFKIGIAKMYVLKDVFAFAQAMEHKEEFSYGKQLQFVHTEEMFTPDSRRLAAFLTAYAKGYMEQLRTGLYGFEEAVHPPKLRHLSLDARQLEAFFDAVGRYPFYANVAGGGEQRWEQVADSFRQKLYLRGKPDGMEIWLEQVFGYIGTEHLFYFKHGRIYRVSRKETQEIEPLLLSLTKQPGHRAFLEKGDVPAFFRQIMPSVRKYMDYELQSLGEELCGLEPAGFRFYLDMPQRDLVTCLPKACYGEKIYSVYDTQQDLTERDLYQEAEIARVVGRYCNAYDEKEQSMAISRDDALLYRFLTEGIEQLQQLGEVYISEALKKIRVLQPLKISMGVSLTGNLLELTLTADNMPKEQLAEILSRYDRKKKFYRLRDGSILQADDELDELALLAEELQLTEKQLLQEQLKVPKYRALSMDRLQESNLFSVQQDEAFRSLVRRMKTVEECDFAVPPGLQQTLREYQIFGYRWIRTLYENGFGGILADDMGLGKTLQVICFLAAEMEEQTAGRKSCLIICPASLVYNWKSELERFAPSLSVRLVTGTAAEREEILRGAAAAGREVLITSYDLLRRDLEFYQDLQFFCQVIDEAQYIKNQGTQAARAVKKISAGFKLALTGTPLENRLSELWSIFDYLMPGYLYSYQRFREEIELPIIQQEDERVAHRLQKMIRPFVLRRLKREVLKELPEKTEENLYARLEGEQQELYDAHVKRLQLMLEKKDDGDFARSKLQILAELTKLRQICCDPGLLFESYQGNAAKLDMAVNLIRSAVENGHKVLLFSQFTTMLERLAQALRQEKIDFYMLTGATPKEKRAAMVEAFQQDEVPVFCISLKAGGTGLNLTAADVVIHFDPWWNVAVQNQATDRAHRIGQTRNISVYRLIAKGTIEEKIIALQEKKQELADRILEGEGIDSGTFTREELLELLG